MPSAASDLSSLAALAWDPSLDVRPALLRVQADLFAGVPSRDAATVAAFETLALGLLPNVDDRAVLDVARRLAPVADTPSSVLRFLIARGGEAARIVIATAPRLPGSIRVADLARNPDWVEAVAGRPDLAPGDVEDLVRMAEPAVDLALAGNRAVVLDGRLLSQLVDRGRRDPALARALLARADLPATDRAALYLGADPEERDAIRQSGDATLRAILLPRASREAGEELVDRAMAGDPAGFEAALARLLGLDPTFALDLTSPERHDLLALALAAAGIGEEDSVRIFLTLDDRVARSVETVFRLVGIVRSTPRSSAVRLVESILDRPLDLRRAGRHQPAHDPAVRPRPGAVAAARERPDARALRAASGRRE